MESVTDCLLIPLIWLILVDIRVEPDVSNRTLGGPTLGQKDSKIVKGKREQSRSLSLKAKKKSSDEESLTSRSEDEASNLGGSGILNIRGRYFTNQ
ncbi:hypothetical protein Tco_0360562 [Tanacetum coccineum]